ncbi:hypothetical protein HJG60_010065 [Phyllostomus discolor]|uniref:Uncharacterized protein n=1 Tax=Phyllostomus discolor TaxID=89673 RepID=A0A834EG21_9CHIR|nr:hypothetical protein HJG60_010065 [Phyllostomus discolor]
MLAGSLEGEMLAGPWELGLSRAGALNTGECRAQFSRAPWRRVGLLAGLCGPAHAAVSLLSKPEESWQRLSFLPESETASSALPETLPPRAREGALVCARTWVVTSGTPPVLVTVCGYGCFEGDLDGAHRSPSPSPNENI